MTEKNKEILNFEKAKEMTVGEAVRKQEDLEAGVSEDDSVLDRYIKKHREDIEADKFDTKFHQSIVDEEDTTEIEEPVSEPTMDSDSDTISNDEGEMLTTDETEEIASNSKKKIWIWTILAVLFIGISVSALFWMNGSDQSSKITEKSSTSASMSSSSAASSSAKDTNVTNFEKLYQTFFTDESLKNLKNSQFEKLTELKSLLDKMNSQSTAYKDAKAKYDQLEKAIKAIQALNAQFDKAVIKDGQLDTTATVKDGQTLTAVATGIESVDATIASAVNFGRSQQTDASNKTTTSSSTQSNPQTSTNTTSATQTGSNPLYGIAIPEGVSLQRDLSRVAYDWDKINHDSNNEAWNFNEGILEKIIATSQARGYISGNQYILEKVNIINGKGYYNLYKPDGTYLFSLNAKTGYFVGNGAGHADDLDF